MPVTLATVMDHIATFDRHIRQGRMLDAQILAYDVRNYCDSSRRHRLVGDLHDICEGFGNLMDAKCKLLDDCSYPRYYGTQESLIRRQVRASLSLVLVAVNASNHIRSSWRLQLLLRRRCAEMIVDIRRILDPQNTTQIEEMTAYLQRMALFDVVDASFLHSWTDDEVERYEQERAEEMIFVFNSLLECDLHSCDCPV